MYKLKAFNEDWVIIKDLDKEEYAIALEISEYKLNNKKPNNVFARQLVRILNKPIHTSFIEAMLFCSTDHKIISERSDLHERIIYYYQKLFFETDEFMGRLDKVEYFQDLINNNKPGDGDHTKGILFQSAFTYGWKYVSSRFHLDESQKFGTDLMEMMARAAFYQWNEETLEGINKRSFYKDTKDVINIVDVVVKAQDGADNEKSVGMMQALIQMNEEARDNPKLVTMKVYDTIREVFIEAPVEEVIDTEIDE